MVTQEMQMKKILEILSSSNTQPFSHYWQQRELDRFLYYLTAYMCINFLQTIYQSQS